MKQLQVEFKDLAEQLEPITMRRKELAAEIEKRSKSNVFKDRLKGLSKEEKAGFFAALAEDLGK